MSVLATAGHVDHGKSTLVRALTGMEPDRWAEERRRGLTIDLGYAWTTLPSGACLALVDVPGHQRFLGNMLAGLAPVPAVVFVVAADEGWRRQSAEHLAAIDALGLAHGLLVITRSDLADPGPALLEAGGHLRGSRLGNVEAVAVSARTGAGIEELRTALDRLVADLPTAITDGPVRLWVDRAFSVQGSGTVATGTLSAGTVRTGDELELRGTKVRVRALQSLGQSVDAVAAVARVAVNLRGVAPDEIGRGDALITPGAWPVARKLDVRVSCEIGSLPAQLVLHVGTSAVPVRLRPLGLDTARLVLDRPLPVRAGDRAVLRDPGLQSVAAGVLVLDADPPALNRRGAAASRGTVLTLAGAVPDVHIEVRRRGAVRRGELAVLGVPLDDVDGLHMAGDWLVSSEQWRQWCDSLQAAVDAADPLEGGLPSEAARRAAGLPDLRLLASLVGSAGLEVATGRVRRPETADSLGPAEPGIAELERRLSADCFAAPVAAELTALRLGGRELAAAHRAGRILRLAGEVVLLPDAAPRARDLLADLPQPFTLGQARGVLGTTRRVAVPLLEHLDGRGWTRRLDTTLREVVEVDE